MVSNAGQDATSQFDDINHSEDANVFMEDLYIGDFYNPDEDKESWEEYVRRIEAAEANKMSTNLKIVIILLFVGVVYGLY